MPPLRARQPLLVSLRGWHRRTEGFGNRLLPYRSNPKLFRIESAPRLAPDVVRIRYEIALDSTDKEAIYFRILLSDDASREERLGEVVERVEAELSKKLKLDDLGLMWYPSFRSESEQAMMKDPAWS